MTATGTSTIVEVEDNTAVDSADDIVFMVEPVAPVFVDLVSTDDGTEDETPNAPAVEKELRETVVEVVENTAAEDMEVTSEVVADVESVVQEVHTEHSEVEETEGKEVT